MPIEFDAADLGLAQREIGAWNIDAGRREHADQPGAGVRRTAHDLHHALAGLDLADPQLVGIRVLHRLDDARDSKVLQLLRRVLDALHFEPALDQPVMDFSTDALVSRWSLSQLSVNFMGRPVLILM